MAGYHRAGAARRNRATVRSGSASVRPMSCQVSRTPASAMEEGWRRPFPPAGSPARALRPRTGERPVPARRRTVCVPGGSASDWGADRASLHRLPGGGKRAVKSRGRRPALFPSLFPGAASGIVDGSRASRRGRVRSAPLRPWGARRRRRRNRPPETLRYQGPRRDRDLWKVGGVRLRRTEEVRIATVCFDRGDFESFRFRDRGGPWERFVPCPAVVMDQWSREQMP